MYVSFLLMHRTIFQNLLRREPLKLVDGGESQRTFIYIKDAIEAVLLMIVSSIAYFLILCDLLSIKEVSKTKTFNDIVFLVQENPERANGHIFNVGNPNNEVTVRQLAEMMTEVKEDLFSFLLFDNSIFLWFFNCQNESMFQVYAKVSGEGAIVSPTVDVSSKEFYGEGYDDSDKRIPDMTIINRQLGNFLILEHDNNMI